MYLLVTKLMDMLKLLLKLIYVFGDFDYNAIHHNNQDTQKLYHNLGWSIIFWIVITLASDADYTHYYIITLLIIGSNAGSQNLFLTEQLQYSLEQLYQYRKVASGTLICKINANILEYRNLRKKITNQHFITIK